MSKVDAPRHDPVPIGEVAQAPFAVLPDPLELFVVRTTRLRSLAQGSELAPYLTFLAALTEVRTRQTQQSLEQLQEGIRKYQAKRGALPAVSDIVKLTDLLFPEYMAEVVRYDAWSHEFKINFVANSTLQLSSAGPDGVPGTADDIRLEVRPI